MLFQILHQRRHGAGFLSYGHINAINRLACFIETLLIDDGINGNSRFTRLTVANDQLTLPAPDGNHRVYGFQTCLEWLFHRLTIDYTRCLTVQWHLESPREVYITFAIDGLSERIDDTSQHIVVHTDAGNAMGTFHHLSFFDAGSWSQEHTTNVVFLQVHHDSHGAVLKFEQFVGLGIAKSVDASHTVAHLEHGAHLIELGTVVDALQLLEQHFRHFAWFNFI